MSIDEKLDLLIEGQLKMQADISKIDKRLESLEERVTNLEEAQKRIEARLESLEERVTNLEEAQKRTEARLESLEERQKELEIKVEGTVNESIRVLYEVHCMHSQRLANYDFEGIRSDSNISATLSKMTADKVIDMESTMHDLDARVKKLEKAA